MSKTAKKQTTLADLEQRVERLERANREALRRLDAADYDREMERQHQARIAAAEPQRKRLFDEFVAKCLRREKGLECFQHSCWQAFDAWRAQQIQAVRDNVGALKEQAAELRASADTLASMPDGKQFAESVKRYRADADKLQATAVLPSDLSHWDGWTEDDFKAAIAKVASGEGHALNEYGGKIETWVGIAVTPEHRHKSDIVPADEAEADRAPNVHSGFRLANVG